MTFTWISILGFSLTVIPYVYFLDHFLIPRFPKRLTTLLSGCAILAISLFTLFYHFDQSYIKMIYNFIVFFIVAIVFYQGTLLKKFLCPFLMLCGIAVAELPIDYMLIYVMKLNMQKILQQPEMFLLLQITVNVMCLLLFVIFLRIIKHNFKISDKAFLVIVIQLFAVLYMVGEIQMMSLLETSKLQRLYYACIMLIMDVVASAILMVYLHFLYKKAKMELSISKLEEEYRMLLLEYQETNKEAYQYLRHDIMNYLMMQEANTECFKRDVRCKER